MTGYTFNQLFDFTRTTAGTFVGSNGLIQTTPASINVLTFTQDFDNAVWSKIGLGTGSPPTVTANAAIAPDGTSTADLVAFNRGAGNAIGDRSTINALPTVVNGLTYVASIYIKAATGADIGKQVAFRGVAGVGYQVITLTADWVRISSAELSSGTTGNFELASRGTISADNQVSALLWGAQLELGSTATTYARNNGGVFPPRFDYDPVTRAPRGILIEEQRTNLLLYSEQVDTAAWVKTNVTVTANAASSPDGASTVDAIIPTTILNQHRVDVGTSITAGTYTLSIFAKPNGYGFMWMRLGTLNAVFDLSTGAVSGLSGGVTASAVAYPNGWYRCVMTAAAVGNDVMRFNAQPTAAIADFVGDGTSSILIWGAQLEAGSFATSYIPTVASQVTRTADVCTISAPMFAPWYNQGQGTFVVDYRQGEGTTARSAAVANDGTNNNTIELYVDGSTDATALPFYGVYVGGAVQAALSFAAASPNSNHKMAGAYSANDFAASVDGSSVATDTSGTLPMPTRLSIGANGPATGSFTNGHIRRVQFYPFRASNNQLQALST